MKSDIINVNSKGLGIERALTEAESVAAYRQLNHKQTMQLRLLVEEMMGMLQGMTGETSADFWLESDKKDFQLNLKTNTSMNCEKRRTLLANTTSGKNTAAKGFMGKIRDVLERALEPYDGSIESAYATGWSTDASASMAMTTNQVWSYSQYRDSLGDHNARPEAWDELEKSIVGKLADEIQISITGDKVKMTIFKHFE